MGEVEKTVRLSISQVSVPSPIPVTTSEETTSHGVIQFLYIALTADY